MPPQSDSLQLSVFTIAYESAADCKRVISDLRTQTLHSQIELIVVASNRGGLKQGDFAGLGGMQWVILPSVRTAGEAMEAAVRAAQAPFVVYAEEHATHEGEWAERILAAHHKGYDAVGFAMANANPTVLTSWAHLYGQFGPVVSPVESGELPFLAGHHVSYRKELLLGYGDLLGDMLEDEGALFLDLRQKGVKMFLAGDAISWHVNISDLRTYIYLDYLGQRSFAAARAKVGQWPWWKRAAFVAATPLIPLVRLWRILKHIYRTGRQRDLLPQILLHILPALLAGAWGEMLGYLVGPGDSARGKARPELQREQFLSPQDPWRAGPA